MPKVVSHARKSPPRVRKRTRPEDLARLTQTEVAATYGVAVSLVATWRAAGAPFGADNRITLSELRRWELAATKAAAAAKTAPTSEDEARARKMAAEAEIKELELARLRGQMVTHADAAAGLAAQCAELRAAVVAMPGRYAAECVGLDDVAAAMLLLRRVQHDLLTALAGGGA